MHIALACLGKAPMAPSLAKTALSEPVVRALAQEVVDQIAAGECVQRPASAVKELVENALDAGSCEVVVSVDDVGGMNKMSIVDNGCGIHKEDLKLAAQRHATSKLRSVDDFSTLCSFGFRGEALSSISMVARLTLVTRTPDATLAYQQVYQDGKPIGHPTPTARKPGTTVTVEDLFYNLPNRKKMRPSDEYNHILKVVQYYAIQYANRGVGLVCQKAGGKQSAAKVDVNTFSAVRAVRGALDVASKENLRSLQTKAAQTVICQVFGSQLLSHLRVFQSSRAKDGSSFAEVDFACEGFISAPSYQSAKRTQLVLFINERLVECSTLKRAMEDTYTGFTKAKPFLYLSLTVPPSHVDVNIHPTKKEVALLHLNVICQMLVQDLQKNLAAQEQVFQSQSVSTQPEVANPNKRQRRSTKDCELSIPMHDPKKRLPSKLIRTSRASQAGALEPFLVPTQSQGEAATLDQPIDHQSLSQHSLQAASKNQGSFHTDDCPLARKRGRMDLSWPGAFAEAASQCSCKRQVQVRLPRQAIFRPKRVIPTEVNYASIIQLRKRCKKRVSVDWDRKIRAASFVGVMSIDRSLVQCGEDLVMVNHHQCAEEMFYQLALARFGGGSAIAKLGAGIDIQMAVAQVVQLEESCARDGPELVPEAPLPVSETNEDLAKQVSACLLEQADMLKEYFSIAIEDEDGRAVLVGLPVILDGYQPSPHGLPLFLLRLATEVDWTEEKPCFHGVCRELGGFYAQLPDDEDLVPSIRHTIFPAISTLLFPPEHFDKNVFMTMTSLTRLYKVFERC